MQYRLSTIFLVFFVAAASLAAFGAWGLFIAAIAYPRGAFSSYGSA